MNWLHRVEFEDTVTDLLGLLAVFLAALLPFGLLILLIAANQREDPRPDPRWTDWTEWASSTREGGRIRRIERSFRRKVLTATMPSAVVSLAEAYTAGADCGCALHDALLEAGRPDLAEPFRAPGNYCNQIAVAERILGRD